MARLYHVDIARHVASADHKWVDNLLSHFNIPGVDGGRQGSARRISADGIAYIALVRTLNRELGLSVAAAVRVADRLLGANATELSIGNGLELRLDLRLFGRRSSERSPTASSRSHRCVADDRENRSRSAPETSRGHRIGAPLAGKTNAYALLSRNSLTDVLGSRSFLALHEVELHGSPSASVLKPLPAMEL
jgi:hypothetical protein